MNALYTLRLACIATIVLAACFTSTASAQGPATLAPWIGKDFHGKSCISFQGSAGVFDYLQRAHYQPTLDMMHEHHFTPGVENLTRGVSTEPMGDIDFVLRTIPNHHRALASAIKFRIRHPQWPASSKGMPAECYLQRAINFSTDDVTIHYQYATLQQRFKRHAGAVKSYRNVERLAPGDAVVEYNMGLALVELKRYKQAQMLAIKVYAEGFPLQGLKKKLMAVGYWKREPKKPKQSKPVDTATTPSTREPQADEQAKATSEALEAEQLDSDTASPTSDKSAVVDNEGVEPPTVQSQP